MAGDATVDADPRGAGDVDCLQDEVPGEVLSRQCEARTVGKVPYSSARDYDCGGIYREV